MPAAKKPRQYEDWPLAGRKCGFGLSWKSGSEAYDLDLQAVAFDSKGQAIDAVYYNNLKACGRGMTHTGDETKGERKGFQEVVWMNMEKMPEEAQLVVLAVASYKGGRIQDARSGKYHILEDNTSSELVSFSLERLAAQAAVIGAIFRKPDGSDWNLRLLEEQAPEGQHFVDILEPTIGDVVRSIIPGAPRRIKASFGMGKGSIVDLPKTMSYKGRLTCAGLAWDTSKGEVDLDVSAIMMDTKGVEIDTVFFGNEEAQGIRHSGDNLTGENATGDNEVITLDFNALDREVHQIFFVITVYSQGTTFDKISGARCRVFSKSGREIDEFCHYRLDEASDQQAMIMARLFRESDGVRWGFQAIGAPCKGRTYKDTLPEVRKIACAGPPGETLRSSGGLGLVSRGGPDMGSTGREDPVCGGFDPAVILDERPLHAMCPAPGRFGGNNDTILESTRRDQSCREECVLQ